MIELRPMPRTAQFVRVFAIACALAVLPFAPLYFASPDRSRLHPLDVANGHPQFDGSVLVGNTRVLEMSVDSETWRPAASAEIGRRLRNLPVGTLIAYRLRDSRGERLLTGVVQESVASSSWFGRIAKGLLGLTFTIAGLCLALAASSRTTALGAGFLSGAGLALGFAMLEPNVVHISSWPLRNLLIAAVVAVPSGLWAWFLPRLLCAFPKPLGTSGFTRAVIMSLGVIAVARTILTTWAQIPVAFDHLPWRFQFLVLRVFSSPLLQTVPFVVASLVSAAILARQLRARDPVSSDTARRVDIIAIAFTVGCGIPLAAIVVQGSWLLITGRLLIDRDNVPLLFLPLLIVPGALMYALLCRHVDSLGVLARRTLLFAIAGSSIRTVTVAPLAIVAILLYRHRDESVRQMLSGHPVISLLPMTMAAIGLRYAEWIHHLVERMFFRERQDARRILHGLAEATKGASGAGDLMAMITQEIDKALHVESVALFLRNPRSHVLVPPPRTSFPPLDLSSILVLVAQRADGPVDVDVSDRGSPLWNISETEQQWLDEGGFRLLVPFLSSDGALLAILALGEKMSELPFDIEDRLLLSAVAASSSLALENHLLRSSPYPGKSVPREEASDDDSELAFICPSCARISTNVPSTQCVADSSTLVRAEVPHILAGKYRFEQRIGSGGMGIVYRVRDLSLGRPAAVKTLPRLSQDAAARMRREARAMASLLHPNVATIFAAESWRGRPMLVVEYLEGGTLARRLRHSQIAISDILAWGIAVCSGIEEAHRQGILHRDIKPSNVGFTSTGVAKVLDFGLARFLDDSVVRRELTKHVIAADADSDLSTALSTGLVGTPAYLSPEAVVGAPPHPDFDVWSLTITLYEALTGKNPCSETTAVRTMNRVLTGGVSDVREHRPDCPKRLAELFSRSLGNVRAERPRTARALREELQKV